MIFNPRHGNGAFAGMNTRNGNKGHDFRFQRRMGSADFLLDLLGLFYVVRVHDADLLIFCKSIFISSSIRDLAFLNVRIFSSTMTLPSSKRATNECGAGC